MDEEEKHHEGPCCPSCEYEWYEEGGGCIPWGLCCCRDERIN